jgi:hypothetical protein
VMLSRMLFTKATLRLVQGPVEGEVGWAGAMQYNPFCLTEEPVPPVVLRTP